MYIIFIISSIIIGYLFGCLQFSYFFGRFLKGIDIRKYGSNNAGASNTTIVLGFKYGILVCFLDIVKTIIPIMLFSYLFKNSLTNNDVYLFSYLIGSFVIIGHNYPFYINFKGGKGTASLIGLLISLDYKLAIIGIATIVLVTFLTDYIVFGTISLLLVFVTYTIRCDLGLIPIIISLFLCILSIYKHIPNIKKIMKNEEFGLKQTLTKKGD